MKSFQTILCFYSISDGRAAISCAAQLAKTHQARLTIIEVLKKFPEKYESQRYHRMKSLYQKKIESTESHLKRVAAPLIKQGLQVDYKLLFGKPHLEIIRQVLQNHHDLVVTTFHEHHQLKTRVVGNVVMQLVRKCPCPVLAIKSRNRASFNRVISAVDLDPVNPAKHALNRKIIDLSLALTLGPKQHLTVAHCWNQPSYDPLDCRYYDWSTSAINQLCIETKQMHQQWLDDFMKTLDLPAKQCSGKLLLGDLVDQLAQEASLDQTDLVVMATKSRVKLPGFLIWHTAEKLLFRLTCSFLIIKHHGFKTSVNAPKPS